MQNRIKTETEIKAMRQSGALLGHVLKVLTDEIAPGMTTYDLSAIAKRELKGTGGTPTFLGQYGFPDVLCVSVNDEVVHGVPNAKRVLVSGDIVTVDFGVTYDGMITDAAQSVVVGKTKDVRRYRLVEDTRQALYDGIAMLRAGVKTGDLAATIQASLERGNYGIVRDLVGHGVGHQLHESPDIPNYGKEGTGSVLLAGMTIAIEPMATLGDFRVFIDVDGWTVRTEDRSLAAHFEHTVLIKHDGYEILTELPSNE